MVVWKLPPPDQRTPPGTNRIREIDRLAEEIKQRPGEWALVAENAWTNSGKPWKRRGFEVRYVKVTPGSPEQRHHIYARWPLDRAG